MLKQWIISAVCGLSISHAVYADFLPENDLWKEDGLRAANMTEAEFNAIIDEASVIFTPLIKKNFNGTLSIARNWNDATVNASAIQLFTWWQVNMYGGLARRPEITRDGFAVVLCHEIGHHLGGYPYSSAWAANEGESDYFSTISCARTIWSSQTAINATFRDTVDSEPKAQCDQVWSTVADQNLCYRSAMAGKSAATLLAALGGTTASWNTPDTSKVTVTNNAHPAGQCRLDTYLAGALCSKNFDPTVIPGKDLGSKRNGKEGELDAAKYSCTQYENFKIGNRPLCWFKPLL